MTFKRPITLASGVGLAALAFSGFALSSGSSAAELVANTPLLAYDLSATIPSSNPPAAPVTAQLDADDAAPQTASVAAAVDPAAVECMAKVVMHEANNQPREGKIAVAQTLVNRLKVGSRFGGSICEIVNQKGQYFHMASFRPRRDSDGWQDAVEVAHQVLAGQAEPVAPGAIYFRASYAPANAFFRTRQRVTTVGAHVFYR